VESFSGRLRDELSNETLFSSLDHARELLNEWQDDYNTVRPHSGIGNLPPSTYGQRDETLRCVEGSVSSRCVTEPHRLKCPKDSDHRWMIFRGSRQSRKPAQTKLTAGYSKMRTVNDEV
jgi:hypothetical protein